jgi:EAL domain-containing protein (putative c-di-GMP-specific phosphodiesterase class I)
MGAELELAAVRVAVARLGGLPGTASLFVNVSPSVLAQPELLQIVRKDAKRLVLEVTEHAPIPDYDRLRGPLTELRTLGARLVIDDVGAGFATFRHILRLAPEIVKLDLSLTRGIDVDQAKRVLASSLVAFAAGTKTRIAAEGIESSSEVDLLRSIGVDFGQGFYLGRPAALAVL